MMNRECPSSDNVLGAQHRTERCGWLLLEAQAPSARAWHPVQQKALILMVALGSSWHNGHRADKELAMVTWLVSGRARLRTQAGDGSAGGLHPTIFGETSCTKDYTVT